MIADVEGQPGALPLLSTALLELWQLPRRAPAPACGVPTHRRSPRCGGAARRGRVPAVAARGAGGRSQASPASRRRGRGGRHRPPADSAGGSRRRRRSRTAHALGVLTEHRLLTVSAGRRRGRARGAAPRMAAAARLARGGRRGPSSASPAGPGGEPLARGRTRSRGAVPRGTTRVRARVAIGARAGARRGRAASSSTRAEPRTSRPAIAHAFAFAGVVGLLVVAVVAAVLALESGERARGQATAAVAQRLGAQALNEPTLDRSLLLARQGVALDDTPGDAGQPAGVLSRNPAAVGVMRGDGDGVAGPRSIQTATARPRRFQRLRRVPRRRTRRRIGKLHQTAPIVRSSRSRSAPTGSAWRSPGRTRRAASSNWPTGERFRSVTRLDPGDPLWETVLGVQFSPDSRVLAAQTAEDGFSSTPAAPLGRADGSADRRHPPIPGRASSLLGFARRPAIGDLQPAGPRHGRPRRRHPACASAGSPSPARSPP